MLTNEDYAKAFHEIKNSITIINSSLQLLEKKHPEVSEFDYWSDSKESLNYLREMVQELSQAKLAEAFTLQPVNPNTLLDNILASIRSLRFSCGFQCNSNIEDGLPLILADSFRLTQALMNLLKNAYEAMNMTGTINLNAYRQADTIQIDITDFGCGICESAAESLFKPFFTSKPYGTGLGLAITRQIIQNHHGKLTYTTKLGEGTTFSVILPICETY